MTDKMSEGLTIFILDDEKDVCHFVKKFFIKRGFDVYTALTGKAAVNAIKKIQPDIAILDIRLAEKEMTGLDILRLIREKRPECQCIVVSYVDDQKFVDQAMKMGAIDYLRKPLMLTELDKAISKIVKKVRRREK